MHLVADGYVGRRAKQEVGVHSAGGLTDIAKRALRNVARRRSFSDLPYLFANAL